MRFFWVLVVFLHVRRSEGYNCSSLGRACVSSNEYITCVSVDGQYVATTGLTITCPAGQVCNEDTAYPCVDGPDATIVSSSDCGPLGRKCISSNEYITCISVDGKYIATTGQVITCPVDQVCREDSTYPCIDDLNSTNATCGPMGRKCIAPNEYITCITVEGEYVATTGQVITCLAGQVCREDTTYACIDDPDATTTSPATSCGSMGTKCISSNEYITCVSVDGEYIATTGQVITCFAGQICKEDTIYPCVDDPDATTISPAASCGPLGRKCISSNEYITCVSVDGEYIATTGQIITCLTGQVCRENTTNACVDDPNATTSSSTTKTTPTTIRSTPTTTKATPTTTKTTPTTTKTTPTPTTTKATPTTTKTTPTPTTTKATPTTTKSSTTSTTTIAPVPTPPTCTEESTFPGPECNQYYHCFAVMWWWSSEILTCPAGQAYDDTSGQCVVSSTCNL